MAIVLVGLAALFTLVLCPFIVSAARATQVATISAGFTPERLGAPTAVSLGFRLRSDAGEIPAPLTGIDLRYPSDLGLATNGLGLATCQPDRLEALGPEACPANSRMGSGTALVQFPIGPELRQETAHIAFVAGPSEEGYIRLLIAATGESPVDARIVMSTVLVPGRLQFAVPLVPSLPGGPDVSVVRLQATIGGNLTYYRHLHGRVVSYQPKGVELPQHCPRGGFRFAATLSFLDGSQSTARTLVACPARHSRREN